MHISCEKCATTYVLDEALIPSSGTAVQCTRCSHVFTAFPPSVTEAPAPVALIEDEPTTSRRKVELPPSAAPRGVNQTIAFGSSAPGAFGSSAPGAFGSSAPGSAPSAGARGASPAVSFGTAAAQQQASPVRGAASAANQTLVFGGAPKGPQGLAEPAGRSDATLPPGPGAGHVPLSFGTLAGQGSSAKTQPLTFGGPGLGQSPGNQTLAFGTVGGQRSANAGPAQGAAGNQTLAFGAVPGAAAGSPKATQVFGTAPVQAAPNQTVAFGAVPGAAAGGPKATQAFGAAPVQAASNQASAFGGAPSGAAGNPKSTQVFGTAPVSPQASGNQTLVFGGGAAKAPPGFGALAGAPRPGAETVPFGKSADAAAVSAASKTIAFGPVGSMPAVPKVTAGTVEISGEAEPEGPRESTVRVSLDAVMREQEDETVEQRHDRTQRYAMADTPGPQDEGGGQPPDRYNRTALFAMSSLQETTRPDAHKPPAVEQTPQPAVVVAQLDAAPSANGRGVDILDPVSTLPLDDAPAPAPAALERSAANAAPADFSSAMTPVPIDLTSTLRGDGPVSATMPNLPSIDRGGAGPTPLPLSMNLVTDEALPPVADPKPRVIERPGADLPLDGVEQMVARSRRRNTIAIVVVLMVVLAAGLGVAYTLFGKALLTPGISPEARASVEQSVTKLRLDDQATRQTEVARLESMVKEYPTFSDAHAALVLALSLELDDLKAENSVIVTKDRPIRAEFMALDEAGRATVAGRKLGASINALVDLQKGLPERLQTQREKLAKAQRAMEVVAEASGGTSSDVALVRARAFSNSVKGEPATFEPSSDFWLQLVPATLALNEEPQSPEKLRQALATLTPMLESEELAQFPRVRFLEARVAFALGERERAEKALEAALAASANYPPAVAMKRILEK